jgi:hypothetical protein
LDAKTAPANSTTEISMTPAQKIYLQWERTAALACVTRARFLLAEKIIAAAGMAEPEPIDYAAVLQEAVEFGTDPAKKGTK